MSISTITLEPSRPSVSKPVPLLDLKAQYAAIKDEIHDAINRVVESQHFILGPEVEALEEEVAAYSQCKFGVGVSSGTDALLVALMAIGIKADDEVITTPYTFFATAGAIARLGAKPIFVDIDPRTYNIDPAKVEGAVTKRTRALIPVHLYGQMAEMDPIMDVARCHGLYVIEDAAQAIGAEYKGRRAGSIGHFGCFSFFPSKNLGGFGDGGMVTTNDPLLADQLKLLRNHGYRPKYYNKVIGGNFRLDALQAAVLRVKLNYLERWTEARQRNADTYRRLFAEANLITEQDAQANDYPVRNQTASQSIDPAHGNKLTGVVLPFASSGCRHIYNQFVIRTNHRDELMTYLKERQIGTEIYYPVPMHLQECFADLNCKSGDFPASECAADETLALPIYPELMEEMIASVVAAINNFDAN